MKTEVIRILFLYLLASLLVGNPFTQPAAAQQPVAADNQITPQALQHLHAPVTSAPTTQPPLEQVANSDAVPTHETRTGLQIAQVGFVEAESATPATIAQSDIDAKIKEVNEATDLDEATKKEALSG